METLDYTAMQARCDELTKEGQELSVTWEGGNDNGWLYLKVDGKEIDPLTSIDEQILKLVEDDLGYGSFAGEFSADGKVVYDPNEKCFVGEDNYCTAENETAQCSIAFSFPEQIWFDSVTVVVHTDSDRLWPEVLITLNIKNGPYPEAFETERYETEKRISRQFRQIMLGIDSFAGIWERFEISRSGLELVNGRLRHVITSFSYGYDNVDLKPVYISVSE